jgi:putative endonuclease
MYYLYILTNNKKTKTYTGITDNLNQTIKEHNRGNCRSAKNDSWKIIFSEKLQTRFDARKREKYFKSCTGRKKIKKLFNNPE